MGTVRSPVAAPAGAVTTPVAGAPCGADDLGRRAPDVATFQVEPVITHVLAVNVANGTNTEQEYTLAVTDTVTTEITNEARIETDFINLAIFKIKGGAKVTVKKINTHTEVSTPDGTVLRWVARSVGTFTTFGADETGSVRCEELYPAGTLRWQAQRQLCTALLAAGGDPVAAAAEANRAAAAAAVAPGFTCDAGYVRVTTGNGQLALATNGAQATAVQLRQAPSGQTSQWRLCHTPTAAGPEAYVLQARWSPHADAGRCLDMTAAGFADEAPVGIADCTFLPAQQFVLYRDPDSAATGLQAVASGSMLAPAGGALPDGAAVAQYGTGRADGTGTFLLQAV